MINKRLSIFADIDPRTPAGAASLARRPCPSRRRRNIQNQKGSAGILTAMMLSLLTMIPIAMLLSGKAFKESNFSLHVAQSDNAARAGLVDAISWFRRQSIQPVHQIMEKHAYPDAAFNPVAINDTKDSTIGIVKE
jgi:hypothetical protein